jgi:hypothetical protein
MRLNSLLRSSAPVLSGMLVWACLVQPVWAQTTATGPAQPAAPAPSAPSARQGSLWPGLVLTGLFGGPSDDLVHYFERYGTRTGFGSDRRTGLLADVPDLAFVYHDGRRDVLTIDRRVWSLDNQHGTARFDTERLRVSGGYGYFRQAANGLDYLFAPSMVAGGVDPAYTGGTVGYVGTFNDNVSDALFATTRTTYDVAFAVKPATFGDKASGTIAVRGIERSGRVFESLNMGGGDVLGTNADRRAKLRWQGYESTVDDSTNELLFTAAVRPGKAVNLEYELGFERFRNDAPTLTFADLAGMSGTRIVSTTAEAGAEGAFALAVADWPLHFVPDSNMLRQSLRASAGNDRLLASAGAGWSTLTQETFTGEQLADGYRHGDVASNQIFVNVAARPAGPVRVEGYARRSDTTRKMDRFESKLRLNAFTLWTYGLEAEVRPGSGSLAVTPGWSRRTVDREIEFGDVPQQRSLFRADSESDEIFMRTQWKLSQRLSLRATPSLLWADETGYITEPERAAKMNLALVYASSDGTRSATVFYTIRTGRNDGLSFVGTDTEALPQDARGSRQQLGAAGTVTPLVTTIIFWSYAWTRDEYDADLIGATTRRYDPTPVFYSRGDRQTYLLGSHTFTVGADITPAGRLQYGISYTATRTAGDVASGLVLAALPREDGRVENWYHTAAFRLERDLGRSLKLGISYLLDYYSDGSYTDLSGGLNSFIVSLGYGF